MPNKLYQLWKNLPNIGHAVMLIGILLSLVGGTAYFSDVMRESLLNTPIRIYFCAVSFLVMIVAIIMELNHAGTKETIVIDHGDLTEDCIFIENEDLSKDICIRVETMYSRIRGYWTNLIICWALMYLIYVVIFFLTDLVGSIKDYDIFLIYALMLYATSRVVRIFFVLSEVTWTNDEFKIPYSCTVIEFFIFVLCTITAFLIFQSTLGHSLFSASFSFEILTTVLIALIFCLLAGRLGSRYLELGNNFLVVLYLYSICQITLPIAETSLRLSSLNSELFNFVICFSLTILIIGKIVFINIFYTKKNRMKLIKYLFLTVGIQNLIEDTKTSIDKSVVFFKKKNT